MTLICLTGITGIFVLTHYQNTSPKRPENRYNGQLELYDCSTDMDEDGVDDQTDILESALAYVNTRPRYKSRYYEHGYPDDGYGVCTDLVAFSVRAAGYDLRELVDEDIRNYPQDYNVDEPDKNIDYRRVRNLQVFFKHNASGLTTDPARIDEWQSGDIVIFSNHIGIVSDRRNEDGVPYVIHHNDPWQTYYEQDILESRDDIAGHYRITTLLSDE